MDAFRFAHAARLMLDHQLSLTGPPPQDLRDVVQDATLGAFENLIGGCLRHQVAFLLLSGDTFDHQDRSPRALAAFSDGCARLAEAGIEVVVSPGLHDARCHWPPSHELPANVTLLDERTPEVVIPRNGRELAVVRRQERCHAPRPPRSPWLKPAAQAPALYCIVLHGAAQREGQWPPAFMADDIEACLAAGEGVDYWGAAGATCRWQAAGNRLVAEPGPLQGLHPSEQGSRGYLLVDVAADRFARAAFEPAAAVCYREVDLQLAEETTAEQLPGLARAALSGLQQAPCERLWLITWNLAGKGPLLARLVEPGALDSRWSALDRELSSGSLRLLSRAVRQVSPKWPVAAAAGDLLLLALEQRLAAREGATSADLAALPAQTPLGTGPWHQPVAALAGMLDPADVARDALRLGQEWLAPAGDSPP